MKITIDMDGIFAKDIELQKELRFLIQSTFERQVKRYLEKDRTLNNLAKEAANSMVSNLRTLQ